MRVAYVSSFPPRECGIATFTSDLVETVDAYDIVAPSVIVAVNEPGATYDYSDRVHFQIERNSIESYVDAASWVNRSPVDLVNLQHEFGLFGGRWGEYVLTLLWRLKKPVVTTLHTILPNPSPDLFNVMSEIARSSSSMVVINELGITILKNDYGIGGKITVIPHGSPDIPFVGTDHAKAALGLKGNIVLSTFGLLSRKKGVEYVINALADMVRQHPEIIYLIIGKTHPEVRKNEGERYRMWLLKMVESLGLGKHVRFINRFLSKRELIAFLSATDIYVAPYIDEDQISSGTLVYALVAGKAIVSTPFLHAQVLLSDGRGLFCKFRDSASISKAIITLLDNTVLKSEIGKKAYEYGRNFTWPRVGQEYIDHFFNLKNRAQRYELPS